MSEVTLYGVSYQRGNPVYPESHTLHQVLAVHMIGDNAGEVPPPTLFFFFYSRA